MRDRFGRIAGLTPFFFVILFASFGFKLGGAADLKYKGMSYAGWWSGAYATQASDLSLTHLAKTGANWISLVVTGYQDNLSSTAIFRNEATPADDELVRVLVNAHALGLKVMLKPHLDLWQDASHWRGEIGPGFKTEDEWRAWFASYRDFIDHFADLAEANGADMFCAGTELEGTTDRARDWRNVVESIRARYHGPLVYAANHSGEETRLGWWDAVDLIGVDAYYAVGDVSNPTLDQLRSAWTPYCQTLSELAARWQKPIIFTEIGYRSISGTASHPWDWQVEGPVDLEGQTNAYQAAFETFAPLSWFEGFFWWSWGTDPFEGGPCDNGYSPHDKPAEGLLRSWYGAAHPWRPEPIREPDYSRTMDVYRDAPGPGWADMSWGAERDLFSTEHVAQGSCSISVRLEPWGSLSFGRAAFSPDPGLKLLEFSIFVPGGQPPRLQAYFYDQDGSELVKRPVEDCRYLETGEIVPGTWNRISIPLNHLTMPGKSLTRICFEDRSGQGSSMFWVDDIRLVGAARPRDEEGTRREVSPINDTIRRH